MTKGELIRWAGMAAVISGILSVITDVIFFASLGDQPTRVAAASGTWLVTLLLTLVAGYLIFLALVGLFAVQHRESGGFGLIGFILASIGTALNLGYLWAGTFLVPALSQAAPEFLDAADTNPSGLVAAGFISTFVLYALGWAVFGIASLRARVLPALPTWLLIAGAILGFVLGFAGLPFTATLMGVGVAWLGWGLWSGNRATPA